MIRKSNLITAAASLLFASAAYTADDILLIEEESEVLIMEDASEDELELTIEDQNGDDKAITFEFSDEGDTDEDASEFTEEGNTPLFKIDRIQIEAAAFNDSNAKADRQGYAHGTGSFNWSEGNWEVKASGRLDAYSERGENDFDNAKLDYDETFIRYRTDHSAITVGAQKIIWGRIDEFPPTDRLSTQDLRRVALDDLENRRLASPAVRYEHFFGDSKIDLVAYPKFREAQLPDRNSAWFPVDKKSGNVLGLKTSPTMKALIKTTPVRENAPDSEGGMAARFTSLGAVGDYGLTLQRGRSSTPYFAYNPTTNTIEGRYPRSWMFGGDIAIEALGGTLKFEGNWLSDTPITRKDGRYTTTESINWGIALELFPGDGDARLNLQLVGQNLLSAPSTIDRQEIYNFNGTYETPFSDNNWRVKVRFNVGLDEKDVYLNPELAYTGFEAQEIYLELHYFDGDEGTPGGFFADNSVTALGWRIEL